MLWILVVICVSYGSYVCPPGQLCTCAIPAGYGIRRLIIMLKLAGVINGCASLVLLGDELWQITPYGNDFCPWLEDYSALLGILGARLPGH